jgi:hypothetical protein
MAAHPPFELRSRPPAGVAPLAFLRPVLLVKGGMPHWSVTPGVVNNQFPFTDTAQILTGDATHPRDWAVSLNGTGTGLIVIRVNFSMSGGPHSYRVEWVAGESLPADTDTEGCLIIGKVTLKMSGERVLTPLNCANWRVDVAGAYWLWRPLSAPVYVGEFTAPEVV